MGATSMQQPRWRIVVICGYPSTSLGFATIVVVRSAPAMCCRIQRQAGFEMWELCSGAHGSPSMCSTRPSLTEVKKLFCGSHTIFWLNLLPKARQTSIGPIRKKTWSLDTAISNFEIAMGHQKYKKCKSLQMGARKLRHNERIPNLLSEFKPDNIWSPFWLKKKLSKTWEIGNFASFRPFYFLPKKDIKSYPIKILRPDLEPSHHSATF